MLIELAVACTIQHCVPLAADEMPSNTVHCLIEQGWPQGPNSVLFAPLAAAQQCGAFTPPTSALPNAGGFEATLPQLFAGQGPTARKQA